MGVDKEKLYTLLVERIIWLRTHYSDGRPRERKMTQEELARSVGVPRTTITNIENLRQQVPFHLFYDICLELNVEARDMLPSMEELGELLAGSDRGEVFIEGKNLQSELEKELVSRVQDVLKK